jgi:adenylylsulfate kinase
MSGSNHGKKGPPARSDVVWHTSSVSQEQREKQNGHPGKVVWLTGLPGSGKSSIAHAVEANLHRYGLQTVVLDGDNIRHGLCADLGFSIEDRNENVRRAGEVAKLFLAQGTIVFVALVSPIRSARDKVRQLIPAGDFIEVYCKCSIADCKKRDPKGLYEKAERGLISDFTGISSPYEEPLSPALTLDTANERFDESVDSLTRLLREKLQRPSHLP